MTTTQFIAHARYYFGQSLKCYNDKEIGIYITRQHGNAGYAMAEIEEMLKK